MSEILVALFDFLKTLVIVVGGVIALLVILIAMGNDARAQRRRGKQPKRGTQ